MQKQHYPSCISRVSFVYPSCISRKGMVKIEEYGCGGDKNHGDSNKTDKANRADKTHTLRRERNAPVSMKHAGAIARPVFLIIAPGVWFGRAPGGYGDGAYRYRQ